MGADLKSENSALALAYCRGEGIPVGIRSKVARAAGEAYALLQLETDGITDPDIDVICDLMRADIHDTITSLFADDLYFGPKEGR